MVLTTKFGSPMGESPYQRGASRRYIMRAVEASLRRLRTDYIDLYMVHQPDSKTPILETLQALDDLVRQGKVRYISHSNFPAWQIVNAEWTARTEHLARPVAAQHPYSLLDRSIEAEVLPAIHAMGLGLIPYFPLASGFLTGKYRPGQVPQGARLAAAQQARNRERLLTESNFEVLGRLEQFASDHGHSLVDLAFAWLLSKPEVGSVIAGATRPDQIDENVRAGTWRLTPDEQDEVAKLV
jgi:aryl-alcohol dehydrogenase-like predicted oxidoreductase